MLITSYYSTIGDEATYRIGLLLSRYALSVKEVSEALGLSQPHVSHKLAKLRKHDYVSRYRDGRRVIYRFKEPWRSILLHGDINWRKLNPEYTAIWNKDLALASTSIDQGRKAANHMLSVKDVPYSPVFPVGIYTFPDISMIGDSEESLKKAGQVYEVGIGYYSDSARGQIIGDKDGMVKLLFDPADRTLLGVHIVGTRAAELIHVGQAVLINKGKLDYFIDTVFNYPTLAEVYKLAALNGFNKLDASLPNDQL